MNENKSKLFKNIRQSVVTTLVLLIICGFIFPLLLNGISALIFPHQANGSLVMADGSPAKVSGEAVGTEFVGQDFTKPYFLKCRPSAYKYNTYTIGDDGKEYYNDGSEFAGIGSGSNNYAPTNPALVERVEADIAAFLEANPDVKREDIPTDLLTASGSGLDPHISKESAKIQLPAISKASGISEEDLNKMVENNTTQKVLGVFGEETVNVLGVNLEIAKAMGI